MDVSCFCCIFKGRYQGDGWLYRFGIWGEIWAGDVNMGVVIAWIVFEAMKLDRSPRE